MVLSATTFGPTFWILGLIGLALTIYCIVDVLRHPDWAWQASGQNKVLWIVLTIVGLFICWLVIDLIYLLAIRPKLVTAEKGGGPMGGGGYSGGGGYGSPGPTYGTPAGGYGTPAGGYGSSGGGYGTPAGGYGSPGGYTPPTPPSSGYTPPPAPAAAPPPGWYPDPAGSGQPRYWNGQSWAEEPR